MGRFGVLLARSGVLRRGVALLAFALAVGLIGAASASAQAPRVLVFHGPSDAVERRRRRRAQGARRPRTTSRSTRPRTRRPSPPPTSRATAPWSSSTTTGDRLNAAQESALQGYIQGGGGFVGIGRAAEAEPANTFVTGLIGARPGRGSPTTASDQVVAVGDRVHPATKRLPLEWTRNDIWYRWTSRPDGHGPHRRALPRVRTRRPATAPTHGRHRLADLLVPRLPGRPLLLHRHGPDRGRLRPRPTSASTCWARSSGPPASSAAAARPRSCPTTRPSAWSTPPAAT